MWHWAVNRPFSLRQFSIYLEGMFLVYLFFSCLAVLGLRCFSARAFSKLQWAGAILIAAFSLQWLLLVQSTGSRQVGSVVWHTGSVTPRHVGSSGTRDWTRVPCIGRQILIHCSTRWVSKMNVFENTFPWLVNTSLCLLRHVNHWASCYVYVPIRVCRWLYNEMGVCMVCIGPYVIVRLCCCC